MRQKQHTCAIIISRTFQGSVSGYHRARYNDQLKHEIEQFVKRRHEAVYTILSFVFGNTIAYSFCLLRVCKYAIFFLLAVYSINIKV